MRIGETVGSARAGFDVHLMSGIGQDHRARRRDADTVFVILDLLAWTRCWVGRVRKRSLLE
jgi:hypothetical protein